MKCEYKFYFPFRVRLCETDSHGHVFNGNYYIYFDTAITEYLRHLGLKQFIEVNCDQDAFHVVKTMAEYHVPIFFDQLILVYVKISRLGLSSMSFSLEIYLEDEDRLLTHGEAIWVNTDPKTRRKKVLPIRIRQVVENFEGDAVNISC